MQLQTILPQNNIKHDPSGMDGPGEMIIDDNDIYSPSSADTSHSHTLPTSSLLSSVAPSQSDSQPIDSPDTSAPSLDAPAQGSIAQDKDILNEIRDLLEASGNSDSSDIGLQIPPESALNRLPTHISGSVVSEDPLNLLPEHISIKASDDSESIAMADTMPLASELSALLETTRHLEVQG